MLNSGRKFRASHDKKKKILSRTLTKTERKYSVTRKELLVVVHFVKHFRHFLYGKTFTVRTDHSSLRWLMNFKNAEGQLARWLEVLSSYNMTIKNRPGSQHQNADALSRIPCKQCGFRSYWMDLAHVNTIATESLNNETAISIQQLQEKDRDLSIAKKWLEKN